MGCTGYERVRQWPTTAKIAITKVSRNPFWPFCGQSGAVFVSQREQTTTHSDPPKIADSNTRDGSWTYWTTLLRTILRVGMTLI